VVHVVAIARYCYYILLHIVAIAHCMLLGISTTTSYCCCMLAALLWVVAHYGLHRENQIWIYIKLFKILQFKIHLF
jgi:hypothetical protein